MGIINAKFIIYLFEKNFFTLLLNVIIHYLLFLFSLLNEKFRITLVNDNIVFEENLVTFAIIYFQNILIFKYFNIWLDYNMNPNIFQLYSI